MSGILITRFTVVGDLNCPFCHTLNEWLNELGYGHSVDLWGIDHMPGLTPEAAATQEAQNQLRSEFEDVNEHHCSELTMVLPKLRPSSTLALALLVRLELHETPERVSEARRLLFEALWQQGLDFSKPEIIKSQLHDFDLGDMNDVNKEIAIVNERTKTWKNFGIDLIPSIIAPTGAKYVGLGTKKALKVFLGSALFSSERAGACKT